MNLLNHEDLYLVHSPELFQESYQEEAVYLTEEEEYALNVFDALNEDFEISTLSDYLAENFEEAELDLIWEAVDYLQSLFYENFDFDSIQEINESILTLDPESIEELLEDWVYEEGISEYTLEDIHESVQSVYGSYDLLQEGIFGFSRKKKAIPTDQYTDSELNRKIEESLSTLKVASLIAEAGFLGKVAKGLKTAKNVADTYSSNRKYVMGKVSNPLLQTAGIAASDILTTKHFIDKLRGKGKDKQGSNTYSAPKAQKASTPATTPPEAPVASKPKAPSTRNKPSSIDLEKRGPTPYPSKGKSIVYRDPISGKLTAYSNKIDPKTGKKKKLTGGAHISATRNWSGKQYQ